MSEVQQINLSDQLLGSFSLDTVEVGDVIKNIDFSVSEDITKVLDLSDDYNACNLMALSLIIANNDVHSYSQEYVQNVIYMIDKLVELQVNTIISNDKFKSLEKQWLQLQELCKTEYDNINVTIFDASKEDLQFDFERNLFDISNSEFFKKVYVSEFDQYGGEPYGAILGLYDFENTEDDITWLTGMGMVAKNSHAPFLGSIDKSFFGVKDFSELVQIKSFETLMEHPKYKNWNDFRELEEATYIGLTVGEFMLRSPYHPENNPVSDKLMNGFTEAINYKNNDDYLWAPSSIQFIKNMMRSYDLTRWFQYVRGVENGGFIQNLTHAVYDHKGILEQKPPLNVMFADYMELSLANVGFIPLVQEKNSANACFFSVNSCKKVHEFVDDFDSANSSMMANISYTMCVSRIGHYIKCVIRDKIGSIVGKDEIHQILSNWLFKFVTTVHQPTPLEMARFPFRAADIKVNTIPGKPGWFKTKVVVIPHVQFEGMDTSMTIDTRLEPELFGASA